jgi:hypothetical protein
MKFRLFKECSCRPEGGCGKFDYVEIKSRFFGFYWFVDCGEWFIYITIGKRWWRFSSCGYLSGRRDMDGT